VTTCLLDTNVVVRLMEPSAPEHAWFDGRPDGRITQWSVYGSDWVLSLFQAMSVHFADAFE
jgi:hypothetical protein